MVLGAIHNGRRLGICRIRGAFVMKRILLILLAAGLWHSSVSADDYYWSWSGVSSWRGASPSSLCTQYGSQTTKPSSSYNFHDASGYLHVAYQYNCIVTWRYVSPVGEVSDVEVTHHIMRSGTECSLPKVHNPATGECAEPVGTPGEACEEDQPALTGFGRIQNSQGQCVDFTRADNPSQCKSLADRTGFTTIYVTFDSDGNPQTPPPTSTEGCETTVASVAHCTMAPARPFGANGSIQSVVNKCKVAVSFTGETAGPGPLSVSTGPDTDGACDPATECPDPSPAPIENESKPCTYVEDGEGRRHCSSNDFNYKPGESSCGSVNGQFTCIGKAPQGDATKIDTTITEKDNADGNKTVTKEDTATVTKCIGSYSCKTEVTNNKTVTIKDGNGNTVSESGTCTGPACSDTGKGNKGNCAPGQECSEEDEEFGGPDNEDVPGFGDSLGSFMGKIQGSPIVSGVQAIRMPEGGSCSIGSATTPIGSISGSVVCDNTHWLDPLYFVFLAMHALGAVRILMSA